MTVNEILFEILDHLRNQGVVRVDQAPVWQSKLVAAAEAEAKDRAALIERVASLEDRLGVELENRPAS